MLQWITETSARLRRAYGRACGWEIKRVRYSGERPFFFILKNRMGVLIKSLSLYSGTLEVEISCLGSKPLGLSSEPVLLANALSNGALPKK